MFVGSYTRGSEVHGAALGKGIAVYKFNVSDGSTKYQNTILDTECGASPSALCVNPKTNVIYACNENGYQSRITQCKFNPDNNFELEHAFTEHAFGNDSCFLSSDWDYNFLYCANYGV